MRRAPIGVLAILVALTLVACKTNAPSAHDARPLPTYAQLAEAQNTRTDKLGRLWARTIVSIHYIDADDKERYEQGDGHLMRRDFDKIAVDISKVGQTLYWFGANEDLYWLFDLTAKDHTVAYVGQLALVTLDKAARASLPVPPLEYMTLAGLTPLAPDAPAAIVSAAPDGRVQLDTADPSFAWRYTFDPDTLLPAEISILDNEGRPVITSQLSDYKTVDLTGQGIDQPRAPGRIAITHIPSEMSIAITIDGEIIDGVRSNKPKPAVFDFDTLVNAYAPDRIIDLDKPEQLAPDEQVAP